MNLFRHPNSYGEYGYEPTNPMLAEDIGSGHELLSRLRMPDGSRISYKRMGSQIPSNIQRPVDKYEISDASGNQVAILYLYVYLAVTAYDAPEGFAISEY
jgi:hypothetical protein